MPLFHSVANSGQISRHVREGAVLLANERGVFSRANHHGAFAVLSDSFLEQIVHDARQLGIIKTFPQRMVKMNVEPLIDAVDLRLTPGHKHLPELYILRIASMELGSLLASSLGNGIGLVLGLLVPCFH